MRGHGHNRLVRVVCVLDMTGHCVCTIVDICMTSRGCSQDTPSMMASSSRDTPTHPVVPGGLSPEKRNTHQLWQPDEVYKVPWPFRVVDLPEGFMAKWKAVAKIDFGIHVNIRAARNSDWIRRPDMMKAMPNQIVMCGPEFPVFLFLQQFLIHVKLEGFRLDAVETMPDVDPLNLEQWQEMSFKDRGKVTTMGTRHSTKVHIVARPGNRCAQVIFGKQLNFTFRRKRAHRDDGSDYGRDRKRRRLDHLAQSPQPPARKMPPPPEDLADTASSTATGFLAVDRQPPAVDLKAVAPSKAVAPTSKAKAVARSKGVATDSKAVAASKFKASVDVGGVSPAIAKAVVGESKSALSEKATIVKQNVVRLPAAPEWQSSDESDDSVDWGETAHESEAEVEDSVKWMQALHRGAVKAARLAEKSCEEDLLSGPRLKSS